VCLIEDGFVENGHLTTIAVGCIWKILELHVNGSLNHLCRLLSFAGLAHRLARALSAVNSEYLYSASQVLTQRLLTPKQVRPLPLLKPLGWGKEGGEGMFLDPAGIASS
jgi:hypothetical protein